MMSKNKIAEITLFFWVLKILATTLGETVGDMLAHTLNLGYAGGLAVTSTILVVLLFLQMRAGKFHSLLFWAAIIGTTTVGTEISDFMDRTLGLGYMYGALLLVSALAIVLAIWYFMEKTLRVYPLYAGRSEFMFWMAVLLSNSLGTAFGDYLSDDLALSYAMGAALTATVIGGVVLLHYVGHVNQVFLFWLAFIFTRPFGATFGDLLTKPLDEGGLDLGTIQASSVTIIAFLLVLFVSRRLYKEVE